MAVQAKGRIAGLDLMKALGLYLVILYHLVFRHAEELNPFRAGGMLIYGLSTFMSICVPLFFTASGALSLTRPLNLRRNTLRAVHFALIMVFWVFASLIAVLLMRREWPGMKEFLTIAWELRVGYIQHLWYLPTFLFLILLTPLLHSLRGAPTKVYRYGILLLGIFTFGNLLLNDGEYLLRWVLGRTGHTGTRYFFWYTDYFAYHYWYAPLYLCLGAFLEEHRHQLRRRRNAALMAIPLCMVCLTVFALARCAVRQTVFDPVFNNYGDLFTLVLTASVSLLLLSLEPGEKLSRAAASLSNCSFGIYLIHWLLIEALMDFLPAVTDAVAFAPLTALVLLAVSWGLTYGLLRIPYVRDLFTASPAWIREL